MRPDERVAGIHRWSFNDGHDCEVGAQPTSMAVAAHVGTSGVASRYISPRPREPRDGRQSATLDPISFVQARVRVRALYCSIPFEVFRNEAERSSIRATTKYLE